MKRMNWLGLVSLVALLMGTMGSAARAGEVTEWRAAARQGDIQMEARYMEDLDNGVVDQALEVRLQNASHNTVFSVAINGRLVGRFTTDANGDGVFNLSRLDVEADENGRPIGPRINTGDVISVFHGNNSGEAVFVPA